MGRLIPEAASLADLQAYIADLEARRGWDAATPETCCFRLGEEVGELFGAVRRHAGDPADAAVAEELVDCLNFLLALANRYGIDLEQAFIAKNSENERREWP